MQPWRVKTENDRIDSHWETKSFYWKRMWKIRKRCLYLWQDFDVSVDTILNIFFSIQNPSTYDGEDVWPIAEGSFISAVTEQKDGRQDGLLAKKNPSKSEFQPFFSVWWRKKWIKMNFFVCQVTLKVEYIQRIFDSLYLIVQIWNKI